MRRLSTLLFPTRRPWKPFETSWSALRTRKFDFLIFFRFATCDDAITEQVEVIMSSWRMFLLCWLMLMSLTDAYPVESKPLNNNPDTWNFGDGWLIFNPRNSADPSASALISSDPHVKKSKITPKSIFIAPNAYNVHPPICPHGYRVDDNGKCIKTVTINQDEILAARISELFGVDDNPNKNSDIDSDYYDFDDESKSDKDSGPLQINLPLTIDIEEDGDGKKVEYIIEEKVIDMRNLNPKDLTTTTTTERVDEATTTVASVTDSTESVSTEDPTTDDPSTTTDAMMLSSSTVESGEDEIPSTTMVPTTFEPTTVPTTTTTQAPTTLKPPTSVKIFSVDFMPKSQRKTNRNGELSARLKNSRDRDKLDRPRKQKTTAISTKSGEKLVTKLYKIDGNQTMKKNRTRGNSKRPGHRKLTTTTESPETITESPVTTQKPFWWLPKGWSVDETREKPVLVRFWAQQPLPQDERARSHNSRQRANSRMPSDNIFREITAPEIASVLKKK